MPILYLNKRQKAELVGRLAKAKGAARTVKQLREVFNFKELEDTQDRNQEVLEKLVEAKIIPSTNVNISKKLATSYGISLMLSNDAPDEIEIDKTLVENTLAKMPKEEDLEGGDWLLLETRKALEDSLESSKSNNKKMVEEAEANKQAEANA